ncbi:dihydrofolate reductase [Aureimonas altamirensis]|uniref:dihydrofolate reductase n=1 Tax=Aureimonas altamirensis TaxID=370622 RepID=UPI0020368103|nr:dihydrofolate reductase [Aureimonas altamirensis]MCM2504555.1 dihydrofolate reductase [Aureimonas altamirensis]
MTETPIVLVVAMARNRVIGADGGMPWTLPTDLARYRRLTMGRPMIMGRRTLDAIGRVLDGRDSIVLSHDPGRVRDGALHANSLEAALRLARASAGKRGADAIMVVGGEEIFRQFMPMANRIEMTVVETEPEGDAFFPELGDEEWRVVLDEPMKRIERDDADARFLSLERRRVAI